MVSLIKVDGHSLYPKLAHGDYVITSSLFFKINVGDIVVVKHARYGLIVKKIIEACTKGYRIAGENSLSVSCEKMGLIDRSQIHSKVIISIKK